MAGAVGMATFLLIMLLGGFLLAKGKDGMKHGGTAQVGDLLLLIPPSISFKNLEIS